ncbi:MAG: hypothetical protein ACERKD_11250 [Prolixibacteraceae bacterium]
MMRKLNCNVLSVCFLGLMIHFSLEANAQQTSRLISKIISNSPEKETDFPLVADDQSAATIHYDEADWTGVIRALGDLQNDINSVTGIKPNLLTSEASSNYEIIIGTLGKSKLIDQLVKSKKLELKDLTRK